MFIWYLFCRYYKYFLGKLHQNLIGVDHEKSVFILSVLQEKSFGKLQLRAILWTKLGPKRLQFCSQAELGTDFIGTERLTESENYTRSSIWGVFYPVSRNKSLSNQLWVLVRNVLKISVPHPVPRKNPSLSNRSWIKGIPRIFYSFVVWPTIANVYKISGYLFIRVFTNTFRIDL